MEITRAFLRPNPDFGITADGFQLTPNLGIWRPLSGEVITESFSYLHERDHKREYRLESARKSTEIAQTNLADQERGLLFNLRNAFIGVLQAKAVLGNATANLSYWDQELVVNRNRLKAGDLAQLDESKLELQQEQFETDYETASPQPQDQQDSDPPCLVMMDLHSGRSQFDVAGPFEYGEQLPPLESFHTAAVDARPDLKAAAQNIELARTNHKLAIANGSTDPTWSVWYSRNASFSNPAANNTIGFSLSIPLKIFDRNQGEKARTQLVIQQNEKLRDAVESQVYSDVDSAYVTLQEALSLLGRYKSYYLPLAGDIRDHTRDAFQHGGVSLLDYLDSEKAYRDNNLNYLNFIGSYLTAAAQMNQAVGKEVIP